MVALSSILLQREAMLRLARQHGARHVRVFGSTLHGDGRDLDVLVRFDHGRSLLDQVALKRDLEQLIGCPVDVVDESALHRSLRDTVLAEAVEL